MSQIIATFNAQQGTGTTHSFGGVTYTLTTTTTNGITNYIYTSPLNETTIASSCFYNLWHLTSITIPSTVTSIGSSAFYGCTGLTGVIIPNSVISIGDSAFYECYGLTSITIPNSVTNSVEGSVTIGASVFALCNQLTTVTFGSLITNTGTNTFSGCVKLTTVSMPGVTSIGSSVFYGCTGLTSITIPAGVTSIGASAFYGCSDLISITIPAGVTIIGSSAFQGCSGLTTAVIQGTSGTISTTAFQGCTVLANITIYQGMTLTTGIFTGCTKLTTAPTGTNLPLGTITTNSASGQSVYNYFFPATTNGLYMNYAPLYTVTYNADDSSNAVPIDNTLYPVNALVTLSTEQMVRTGYIFDGWYSQQTGGSSYTLGISFDILSNTTLYAQWTQIYTLTYSYSVNDFTGTVPTPISYGSGSTVEIPDGILLLARILGDKFSSWNTAADGSGTSYYPNDTLTINDNTTLYAQAAVTTVTCTVTYNGNGSTGTVPTDSTSYNSGAIVTVLGNTGLSYTGFTFNGWNTTSGGNGTSYAPGNAFSITNNTTLYAQWLSVSIIATFNTQQSTTTFGGQTYTLTSSNPFVYTSPINPTTIAANAFTSNTALTSITIPATVTSITIPATVTSIGNNAFQGCSALTSVIIGYTVNTVTSIGSNAFFGCTALTSITLPPSSIGGNAFQSCTGLTRAIIIGGNGVGISPATFQGCTSLANITIYKNVYLNKDIFTGCTLLQTKTPNAQGSYSGTITTDSVSGQSVYNYFFPVGNTNTYTSPNTAGLYLNYINATTTLPSYNVTYNGGTSFIGSLPTDSLSPYSSGTSVTVSTALMTQTGYTFNGWNTSASVGSGITSFTIATNTILYAQWTPITYTLTYDGNGSTGTAPVPQVGTSLTVSANTFTKTGYTFSTWNTLNTGLGTSYAAGSNITIATNTILYAQWIQPIIATFTGTHGTTATFGGQTYTLTSSNPFVYTSPSNPTSIPDSSFLNTDLISITIPAGVTSIGWKAFYSCYSLTSVTIPDSVTIIANSAFFGCYSLTSIIIPNSVTSLGTNVFQYCSDLKSVTIGNSVPSIGTYAFQGCSALASIIIGSSVTSIGNHAFDTCTLLSTILIPNSVTILGSNAFQECIALTSITIPAGVTSIGTNTFQQCTGLTTAVIQGTSGTIYTNAFQGCTVLANVTISQGTNLQSDIFTGCTLLQTKTPNAQGSYSGTITTNSASGQSVYNYFFPVGNTSTYTSPNTAGLYLNYINATTTLPSYNVTYNGGTSFMGTAPVDLLSPYSSGTSVTVSTALMTQTGYTFNGWNTSASVGSGITSFTIATNTILYAQWTPITYTLTYDGNGSTGTAPISQVGTSLTVLANTFTKTGYTFSTWNTLNTGLGTSYAAGSNITISANTTLYAQWIQPIIATFTGTHGTTATFGDQTYTLTSSNPFVYTSPSNPTSIPDSSFLNTDLISITIPATVTSIGSSAFQNCSGLTSITIPAGVTSINVSAFQQCTGLTSITIPAGVTSIKSAAFQACTGLTSITIPAGVTSIGGAAFQACGRLTSIIIPAGVTSIGTNAFLNCTGLTTAVIQGTSGTISTSAFQGCAVLVNITIYQGMGLTANIFLGCSKLLVVPTGTNKPLGTITTNSASGQSVYNYFLPPGTNGLYMNYAPLYTVTYNGTGSPDQVPVDNTLYPASATVTVSTATMVQTGYTFNGWYTLATGGTKYSTSFTIASNTILYAQWTQNTYTVTYNGNNSTTGQVPTDSTSYNSGTSVTFLGNTGSLVKTGYTFMGWNTDSSGTGTGTGTNTTSFNITNNTTLYAQWTQNTTIIATFLNKTYGLTTTFGGYSYNLTYTSPTTNNNTYYTYTCTEATQTTIVASCFFNITQLTSITIPTSVTSINASAFQQCTGLTSIAIPAGVTIIGASAFQNCSGLTSIAIPVGVTSITSSVFNGCTGLTSIAIPVGVTNIGSNAFIYCVDLASIIIPNTVTSIGSNAFYSCYSLTSVTIPDSVTSIGSNAFQSCTALVSITIPDSVTNIDSNTFQGCSGLTTVVIQGTSGTISTNAFAGCTVLANITIYQGKILQTGIFTGCAKLTTAPTGTNKPLGTITTNSASGQSVYNYFFPLGTNGLYMNYAPLYTLIYNGNGSTGTAPAPQVGTSLTVSANTFTKTGYTFSTWNTLNTGLGTSYAAGSNITISTNTILYAQWTQTSIIATFTAAQTATSLSGWTNTISGTNYIYTSPSNPTAIADSSFDNLGQLIAITIPATVTSIGNSAFQSCSALPSITIPNSVTSLGASAFFYCSALASITIPNSVTSIGNSAFSNCSDLTSVTIPNSVTSIANSAFSNCSDLTSVTIPNSVTSIGDSAFYNCSALTSITIPNSVTSIGNYAFYYCYLLTSIIIPAGVTSIGNYAFSACSKLTTAVIQGTNGTISTTAFQGCTTLANITIYEGMGLNTDIFTGCTLLTTAPTGTNKPLGTITTNSASGQSVYNYFFPSTTNGLYMNYAPLYTVTYDGNGSNGGLIPIDSSSPYSINALVTVLDNPNSLSKTGFIFNGWNTQASGSGTSITSFTILNNTILYAQWTQPIIATFNTQQGTGTTATFGGQLYTLITSNPYVYYSPANITSIADSSFTSLTYLVAITIPDSVTSIGNYAFTNCSALTSITIPNSVASIGSNAFQSTNLTSVTIPDSVTSIGNYTFNGCSALASVTILAAVASISEGAFSYCSALTSITIPDSVTSIGNYTFYNCSALASITIPDSVTSIGTNAFNNCSVLASITIPDSVASISEGAFQDCSALTSITIPDSVTSIGSNAFQNCSALTSITIPDSVTSIGTNAFYNCTGLTSITIPAGVTSIGASAFQNCPGLTSITIPAGVTSINVAAFQQCTGLTSIAIPAGVTSINVAAFQGCSGLTSITIPAGVTSIGTNAFYGCSGLTTAVIQGTSGTISTTAFQGCTTLANITIYQGMALTSGIFTGCAKLTTAPTGTNKPLGTITTNSASGQSVYNYFFPSTTNGLYMNYAPLYTVTYDGTGSTDQVPVDNTLYPASATVTVSTALMTQTGYAFNGWNTTQSVGSGITSFTIASNTILYAQWTLQSQTESQTYTVTYDGNNSDGGTAPAPQSTTGTSIIVSSNPFTKTGYTFTNWNTHADGFGTSYIPNSSVIIQNDTPLYAQWLAIIPISNICFPANTLIKTNKGLIPIKNINPDIHTINNKKIIAITKTISADKYLVRFDKHSLGINYPSEKTIMSKYHKICHDGVMTEAFKFADNYKNVIKIKYDGEILYNILLEEYDTITINNLICETLHPQNIIAKLYTSNYSEERKNDMILLMNYYIETNNYADYDNTTKKYFGKTIITVNRK